jgi:hypothetical protein
MLSGGRNMKGGKRKKGTYVKEKVRNFPERKDKGKNKVIRVK